MMSRITAIACVLLLVGGCADGTAGPDGAAADPANPGTVPGCPNFVTEVATGPPPTNITEDGPLAMAQERLADDITAANAYGMAHPEDFGSIRYENTPTVRIVIGFTDHLDVHCAALRDLLEYPDEFELVKDAAPQNRLLAIQEEISATFGEYVRGSGIGASGLAVSLRADGEEIAARIVEEYGNLVNLTVGALPYPDPTSGSPQPCEAPPPPTDPTHLVASATLSGGTVAAGHDYSGTVTVTNTGDETVAFESGSPLVAFVYPAGGTEVVGIYTGGIAGVGVGGDLAPGESIDIDVIGGTASCDPDLGYALPPGDYDVRVPVELYEHPSGGFAVHAILSDPVPLEITG
jgi:hypothetical protein